MSTWRILKQREVFGWALWFHCQPLLLFEQQLMKMGVRQIQAAFSGVYVDPKVTPGGESALDSPIFLTYGFFHESYGCQEHSQIHCRQIPVFVYHGQRRMDFVKVYLMSELDISILVFKMASAITNSSSIVSCGGNGSSKPRPIISQVKVLSSMPMLIFMSAENVISMGAWGDSPL